MGLKAAEDGIPPLFYPLSICIRIPLMLVESEIVYQEESLKGLKR